MVLFGCAATAVVAGLAFAQPVIERTPPPPPGYVPGVGYATPPEPAPPPPVSVAAPPDEAPIPAEAVAPESPNLTAQAAPAPPPEPLKRPRFTAAVLQAVDKTTAETLRFEAKVNEPVRYKGLVMTVHACEGSASDESGNDAFAHMDIQSRPDALSQRAAQREVFRGWMFANSPGLHPVEHPIYDVWLIACKTPAPPPEPTKASAPPAAPAPPKASAAAPAKT
ncbi:MAG: DUF2155 domain-containing protein [Caulobacteraceae bacterium]